MPCNKIYLLAVDLLQGCSFAYFPGDGSVQGSGCPESDDSS